MNPIRKAIVGSVLVVGTLGGGAIGAALTTGAASATAATTAAAPATDTPHTANGITETALTGTNKTKAEAAALKAVPGATVVRSETDAEGAAFEVHLKKADGSAVTVKLDANFAVTATEEGHGPGKGGGHGPHTANGITETALTGTNKTKAEAAAVKAVPGATVVRSETDAEGAAFEVHLKKADGSAVTVKLDASFKVTATEAGRN
ncbi:MAG: hypothetical protein JWO77_1473 [Ilumatobacteraceae bacterium]|nr:hypothetical protein [Ilumatobacteraceae bacterium]